MAVKRKRKVKRRRKSAYEAARHAAEMVDDWERKRRLADTKVREWNRRMRYYTKRMEQEMAAQKERIAELEQNAQQRPRRAITFAEEV